MALIERTMAIAKDRFVTEGVVIPYGTKNLSIFCPKLDDNATLYLNVADRMHRFNYPWYTPGTLIAEFDFDDADGSSIIENVQGLELSEINEPTYAQSAATIGLGKGITFSGTEDAFDILCSNIKTPGAYPTTGDFSVEMVFNGTNGSGGDGDTLMSLRDGAAGVGFQLEMDASEQLEVHMEDATSQVTMSTTTDICTGSIVHLGVDFDRDGYITAYVNGAAVTTAAALTSNTGTVWPGVGANARLSIGRDAGRTAGDCFTGTIYFLRIYNKILGASGWLDNYNVMIGNQYPGWVRVTSSGFSEALTTSAAEFISIPEYYLPLFWNKFIRIELSVEQTTTPQALDFIFSLE